MGRADEFREIAAEMARYAERAILPEIRADYAERARRWMGYADDAERGAGAARQAEPPGQGR